MFCKRDEKEASRCPNSGRSLSYHSVFQKEGWLGLRSTISYANPGATACVAILYLDYIEWAHSAWSLPWPVLCKHKMSSLSWSFSQDFLSMSFPLWLDFSLLLHRAHTVVHKPVLSHTTLPHHHTSYLCEIKRTVSFSPVLSSGPKTSSFELLYTVHHAQTLPRCEVPFWISR